VTDSNLIAARTLMGDSLGFHIIFVLFGLTLPILVSWFEWMGLKRHDQKLLDLAHFWSKIMALLVITGVISGTIIALQMSLVWPGILKFGGQVIGLPFMFETYAFLIEAVFLALYMKTWKSHINPWLHWVFGLMVVLGSTASAYTITSVNAWMNLPAGFTFQGGKIDNISVWHAMFSRTAVVEFIHSMPAYWLAASLSVAGFYAIKVAREKRAQRFGGAHKLDWFIIRRLMLLSSITIPDALSILAGNSPSTVVQGLDKVKKSEQPPLWIHTLFDIKMTLMNALVAALVLFWLIAWKRPKWFGSRLSLLPLSLLGLITIAMVELGWMITEIGRQPWAVRGYVTVEQAITKTHKVASFGYIFPLLYVILFAVTVFALRRIISDETKQKGAK
jgi:cytochrome d ubiquinol oxidase subunit I